MVSLDWIDLPDAENIPAKKWREIYFLDRLRQCWPGFPTGRVTPAESPDFLVRDGEAVTGIEVTEFYLPKRPDGTTPAEQESLRWQVANRAAAKWVDGGGPPLWVSIHFANWEPLELKRVDDVAAALNVAVRQLEAPEKGDITIWRDDTDETPLPKEVECLCVRKGDLWAPFQVDFVQRLTPTALQAVIDNKAAKYRSYAAAAPNTLLVIVIDEFLWAALAGLSEEVLTHSFPSPFTSIIVLVARDRAVELLTGPSPPDSTIRD